VNRPLQIVDVDDGAIGSRTVKVLPTESAYALHGKAITTGQGDGSCAIVDQNAALPERRDPSASAAPDRHYTRG